MTEAIIVIIAILVLVAVFMAVRSGRERKLEGRRTEAQELRETAQTHDQRAELEQAEADRRAARARKAQAEAEEQAAIARTEAVAAQEQSEVAEREGSLAREHHERAQAIDPDARDDDPRDERDERDGFDGPHERDNAHADAAVANPADPAFSDDRRGEESRR